MIIHSLHFRRKLISFQLSLHSSFTNPKSSILLGAQAPGLDWTDSIHAHASHGADARPEWMLFMTPGMNIIHRCTSHGRRHSIRYCTMERLVSNDNCYLVFGRTFFSPKRTIQSNCPQQHFGNFERYERKWYHSRNFPLYGNPRTARRGWMDGWMDGSHTMHMNGGKRSTSGETYSLSQGTW